MPQQSGWSEEEKIIYNLRKLLYKKYPVSNQQIGWGSREKLLWSLQKKLQQSATTNCSQSYPTPWVRPTNWLELPDIPTGEDGLYGVYEITNSIGNNWASIQMTVNSGSYVVEWGDGSTDVVASGTKIDHLYNYSTVTNPVLSDNTKQVLIKVYPQTAGSRFTIVNLQARATDVPIQYATGWLDLQFSSTTSLTSFIFNSVSPSVNHTNIERFVWKGLHSITDFSYMFSSCRSLKKIEIEYTTNVTNYTSAFTVCGSLSEAPELDLSNAVTLSAMFLGCYNLVKIPQYNYAKAVSLNTMFSGCRSIEELPEFYLPEATNLTSMFNVCQNLKKSPTITGTTKVTNVSGMFGNCEALTDVTLFDTQNVTNFSSMFNNCSSLIIVPLFNTAKGTNFTSMFSNCYCLKTVPAFNMNEALTVNSMFNACPNLEYVPLFNWSKTTTAANAFDSCTVLQYVPAIPLGPNTLSNNIFNGCSSLASLKMTGFKNTVSISNTKLSATEITSIIDILVSPTTPSTNLIFNGSYGVLGVNALNSYTNFVTVAGNTTITRAAGTTGNGFAIGAEVRGTGVSTDVAVTFTASGSTVNRTAHGLFNGKIVSFPTIVTTTGITVYTLYYVVNATADTFQIATTLGGTPITLTNNGSGTMRYQTLVTQVNAGSIVVDVPPSASGTVSLTLSMLPRFRAFALGWNMTA